MPFSCENPLGLEGFAFVEFTGPDAAAMAMQLEQLGFVEALRHPAQKVSLYRQGDINFILNAEPFSHASEFAVRRGPSACGLGFKVADAARAYRLAQQHGAAAVSGVYTPFGDELKAVKGVGGALIYLIDDTQMRAGVLSDWLPVDASAAHRPVFGAGLRRIDHLTHNLHRGQMQVWADFYVRVFGFESQRYFDIDGQVTGLKSQAMIAPDGQIRIPLNESKDDHSQIEEFLNAYKGEGIQHIALTTDDIHATVEGLRARGVKFQETPDTYYELIGRRVTQHEEDVDRLRANRILIDGDAQREGILLQIFTENTFGPIFFEIIQRKGNQGFGAGNFQALFESIELDQIRRGTIRVNAGT